jgi:zinc-finger of transposase IS204/IS1001/IS1096/IS1165
MAMSTNLVLPHFPCCWACTRRPDRGETWTHVHGALLVPSPLLSFVPSAFQVARVLPTSDQVTIDATPRPVVADCPSRGVASHRIHSVYRRVLHDLPWQGRPVTIQVAARRFRCPNGHCSRQTFAERLVGVMALSSRRTGRLRDLQRHLALALSGEAGARLAARLAIPTSPDTLLRLASTQSPVQTPPPTPRVSGTPPCRAYVCCQSW